MLEDRGANVSVIAGHSRHINHNLERLEKSQNFEGVHGRSLHGLFEIMAIE